MKTYKAIYPVLFSAVMFSCNRQIKQKKGSIDVFSNVYFNASHGLSDVQSYHVSKLSFSNDTLIELIPDQQDPVINTKAYLITDSTYRPLGSFPKALTADFSDLKNEKKTPLARKPEGAIFAKQYLPNYAYRQDLTDTILFGKQYKRFQVVGDGTLTRYYVHPTDTILPYTIYGEVRQHYKGRIERIDSYNKKKDIFVTLQLFVKPQMDPNAASIFSYNQFLQKHQ